MFANYAKEDVCNLKNTLMKLELCEKKLIYWQGFFSFKNHLNNNEIVFHRNKKIQKQ